MINSKPFLTRFERIESSRRPLSNCANRVFKLLVERFIQTGRNSGRDTTLKTPCIRLEFREFRRGFFKDRCISSDDENSTDRRASSRASNPFFASKTVTNCVFYDHIEFASFFVRLVSEKHVSFLRLSILL